MLKNLKNNIINEHFFRPRWYSVFINPYFINRYSLLRSMQTFTLHTSEQANIIDVGCGLKPYRDLFLSPHYTGIDIAGGGHNDSAKTVDIFFDGTKISFPDNSFDTLICTQVLEHANDPEKLVSECARVLSSNGRAFFSMPFTYPEHETPYDFRRFTRFELERLLAKNNFSEIKIIQTTGFMGTFAQLLVIWLFESIPFRSTLLKTILTAFIFAPIQIIGLFVDKITGKSGQTMDYVVLARQRTK